MHASTTRMSAVASSGGCSQSVCIMQGMVPGTLEMPNKHVFPTPAPLLFHFFPSSANRLTDGSKDGEMREQRKGERAETGSSELAQRHRVSPKSHVTSPGLGSACTCLPETRSRSILKLEQVMAPRPWSGIYALILIHTPF